MHRARVQELHFICPFETVPSVLRFGILCKSEQRRRFPDARSIADPEVQELRASKVIPGGGRLHGYANLYFDSHNAMLSRLRHLNDTIAIIRVDDQVLDLPDVIVTDRNAAAGDVIFRPAESGLGALNEEDVYKVWWSGDRDSRQKRCAEVLVPRRVPPEYIRGAYVRTQRCRAELAALCPGEFDIVVDHSRYF